MPQSLLILSGRIYTYYIYTEQDGAARLFQWKHGSMSLPKINLQKFI